MNLEAARLTETRASTWARFTMAACFAMTSLMLAASLNISQAHIAKTLPGASSQTETSVP